MEKRPKRKTDGDEEVPAAAAPEAAEARTRAAQRRKAVDYARATWSAMPSPQRREVLLLFEEWHTNHAWLAIRAKKAVAGALNWVVLAFSDEDEWQEHADIFERLRSRLTRAYKRIEPYRTAIQELGANAEDVHPQAIRNHLAERHPKTYNAQLNRQNDGLDKFQAWASRRRPELTRYVTVFVALVGAVALEPLAEAAMTSAGSTTTKVALPAAKGRIVTHWKLLTTTGVIGGLILAWYLSYCGPDEHLKTANSEPQGPRPPAGVSPIAVTEADAGSAIGALSPLIDGSIADPVHRQPFFRLMSLSQSSITTEIQPDSHAFFDVYNWEDSRKFEIVPTKYIEQWQRVKELERRSAQASAEGRNEDALSLYEELQTMQSGGWEGLANRKDISDYILVALNRRLGRLPKSSFQDRVSGPLILGLIQYEVGRLFEEKGEIESALTAYGSCNWRSIVTPQNVLTMQEENLAASNWSHLGRLREIQSDAHRRAMRLASDLVKRHLVVISNGVALFSSRSELMVVVLDPDFLSGCTITNATDPLHYPAPEWHISSDYEGVHVEHPPGYGDKGLIQRSVRVPLKSMRTQLVIYWRMELLGKAVCDGIASTIDFCFLPDGRLMDVQACP